MSVAKQGKVHLLYELHISVSGRLTAIPHTARKGQLVQPQKQIRREDIKFCASVFPQYEKQIKRTVSPN